MVGLLKLRDMILYKIRLERDSVAREQETKGAGSISIDPEDTSSFEPGLILIKNEAVEGVQGRRPCSTTTPA